MTIKAKKKKTINKKQIAIIASAISLIIIAILTQGAIKGHKSSQPLLQIDKDIAEGIDVSVHNGKINWQKVSEDIDFAIIRVGYRGYGNGELKQDKKAKYNIKHAIENDVPVGVYVYSQATTKDEAIEEAQLAIKVVKDYDIALPIFIDFEYAYNSKGKIDGRLYKANLSQKDATEIINAFCNEVQKTGYKAGVYASTYIYKSKISASSINKNATIWVADYNENITYDGKYDIWQYTDKGKLKGIGSKYVDKDYWYLKK